MRGNCVNSTMREETEMETQLEGGWSLVHDEPPGKTHLYVGEGAFSHYGAVLWYEPPVDLICRNWNFF